MTLFIALVFADPGAVVTLDDNMAVAIRITLPAEEVGGDADTIVPYVNSRFSWYADGVTGPTDARAPSLEDGMAVYQGAQSIPFRPSRIGFSHRFDAAMQVTFRFVESDGEVIEIEQRIAPGGAPDGAVHVPLPEGFARD